MQSLAGERLVCYTAVFSVVTQRCFPGALRDDTKNGCVADYLRRRSYPGRGTAIYGLYRYVPGYVVTQRSLGALRDDTKNGCVAD